MDWWAWRVDPQTAAAILADMRLVAEADKELHERELNLIEAFAKALPEGTRVEEPFLVEEPRLQEAWLRAMLLLAWSDGELHDDEVSLVEQLASRRGIPPEAVDIARRKAELDFLAGTGTKPSFGESLEDVARAMGARTDGPSWN